MTSTTNSENKTTVAYLGPPGTFSHQIAYERFGDDAVYIQQKQITDVFEAVEKKEAIYGVVPYENSTFGSVVETLDYTIHTTANVIGETFLTVHQCLLSKSPLDKITKVYSHPQALGQSQKWLSANLPQATRIPVKSTAQAAEIATKEEGSAAICSEICSQLYGLNVVAKNIEHGKANTTRFLIISLTTNHHITNDDHTLLQFTVDHQQPGALCDGLKVFKDHHLNLYNIDSRPSGLRPWHYVFFIECSGHHLSDQLQKAIIHLNQYCLNVKVLGSFSNQRKNIH
ncbi:Prephenate dehydratase-domain-containing protein [Cunninghamella echinulata]|nr:Prephenate dehydratase-domain-containing protein [Cunninghamella echinulata]